MVPPGCASLSTKTDRSSASSEGQEGAGEGQWLAAQLGSEQLVQKAAGVVRPPQEPPISAGVLSLVPMFFVQPKGSTR